MKKILILLIGCLFLLTSCSQMNEITGRTTLDIKEKVSCDQVSVGFVKIAGKSSVCYEEGFIRFNVENLGEDTISGIIAKSDGAEKAINKKTAKGEIISDKVAFGIDPSTITIIPTTENNVICKQKQVVFEGIYKC